MGQIQQQITALHQTIVTAQTQVDALTKQLCQIGGTLFNDSDADGQRDSGDTVTGVRNILLQPGAITAASDAAGNYSIAGLDPGEYRVTRSDFPAGYRLSNPTTPGGAFIAVTLAAGEHRTIDIGTTNRTNRALIASAPTPPVVSTPPIPPAPPVASTPSLTPSPVVNITQVSAANDDVRPAPSRWPAIGACIALSIDAKDEPAAAATAAKAAALGLTHLRSFGPACKTGGALDGGYANQVRRLTSRGLRVVVMHGAPQGDAAHTTYAEDDWKRYFDAVARARNGNDAYEVELQNELNLSVFWPLGGGAAMSAAAVAKVVLIARIARAALGPAATIIGPSIGWGAVQPHLDYQRALLDAGLLDSVSALNTHLYFNSPQAVADVLGPYREWAGQMGGQSAGQQAGQQVGVAGKIYSTEIASTAPLSGYGGAAAFVQAVRAGGVVPMVYRLVPRGDNEYDDRCLFTAAGAKNGPVIAAWLG